MTVEVSSATSVSRREAIVENRPRLTVRTYASFDELPGEYESLFKQAEARNVFQGLAWYRNFVGTSLKDIERVRIFGVESEDGTQAAALPLRHEIAGRSFKPRTLFSLSNYYTPLYEPVLQASCCAAVSLNLLAQAISVERPAWDMVNLKPLCRESPHFSELVDSFHRAGWLTQTYFCFGNWYLQLNGSSYEEYFRNLPSALQNTVKRKTKKLEKSHQVKFQLAMNREDLELAIQDYTKIYNSSWKTPEPHAQFMPGLVKLCAENGWLRLGLVYVDGEPAAAQVWIVKDGVASIYKLAYDEKFARLSVGTYLTSRLMQHVFDVDRVSEVDYLTGDDSYKKDWMSTRRERWGILALNPRTVMGWAAIARHIGGRALKQHSRAVLQKFRVRRKTS
jgi:CelD/BcsL family acetyltransferase involved in cellulose biosynthesis